MTQVFSEERSLTEPRGGKVPISRDCCARKKGATNKTCSFLPVRWVKKGPGVGIDGRVAGERQAIVGFPRGGGKKTDAGRKNFARTADSKMKGEGIQADRGILNGGRINGGLPGKTII